jgi:glycosyltransferase involved in cell wall biosynthesis
MSKYKVLHVTNYLDFSGQQENTLYTVSNLNQERFEGHLAANLSKVDRKIDNVLARRAESIPHIKLHDLPHVRYKPNPIFDTWALIDMIRLMRAERYHIVHTHASKVGLLGRIAAKLSGVPIIIYSVHGWSFQYPLIPKFICDFFLWLEKIASKITDHYVTVNRVLLEDGIRLHLGKPQQFSVVRSGMNLDRFLNVEIDPQELRASLGIPPTGPIVGTVMLFYRRKSPESIVKIAPDILKKVPDTSFLLVGDGEMMPTVRSLVQELGLEDRVIITGFRKDPHKLMALMDVFVHPALVEILPRVIVQAQATGTSVVSTRLGGIPEVIRDGETGFLVPPGDLQALSETVIRLLKNPGLRRDVGQAARKAISADYTVEAMVKSIEDIYYQLIEHKLTLAT